MRVGQNPAKSIEEAFQPEKVTVALVTYIPFLGGYYAEGLEVLKICLGSLWQNTDLPYDLVVFDNASAHEVRSYLVEAQRSGRIQYLVLSDKNVGKGGAWNFLFGAAPGEYIAYADSDIYFYPGWLSAQIKVLDTFPNAGMVTGIPLWSPEKFSTSTIEWAQKSPGVRLERGKYLSWEDYWRHSRSLGTDEQKARASFDSRQDYCLIYGDQRFFIGAGHFQFVAKRAVLQDILPIPTDRPMGQVRSLDIALNQKGYLRLSTSDWWVQHLGNTIRNFDKFPGKEGELTPTKEHFARGGKFWKWKPARWLLFWFYDKAFEILYHN
ncbi:MAG TPA: glycosyltransferase family A protein [Anaerolineales bacterium]|nr:glycosyltransferase family A protein [Anaerolineales bacterium]